MASTNLQYVRFYPEKWAASGTVQNMTMEEVGVYWTLLVIQMVDGFVPSDPALLVRRLNVKDEEEARRLLTPKVLAKFHPDPQDPAKLYNSKLSEVTSLTMTKKEIGEVSAFKRWNPDPMPDPDAAQLDFNRHLKRMPRRKVKGVFDKAGWERGVAMLKYITTQEEADRLYAAIDAYARERRNEDAAYHMSFGNFMCEWENHVPANYKASDGAQPEESPAAIDKQGAESAPRLDKPKWRAGDPAPWIVGRYDTAFVKSDKINNWADRSKREAWLEKNKYPKEWADFGYEGKLEGADVQAGRE